MYKTVRKGDASLQYTILPQNEQFYNNPPQPLSLVERNIEKIHKIYALVVISLTACAFLIFLAMLTNLFFDTHHTNVAKVSVIDHQLEPIINETETERIVGNDDVSSTASSEDSGGDFVTELGDQPSTGSIDDFEDILNTNSTPDIIKMTYLPRKINVSSAQPPEMNFETAETTSYLSSTSDPPISTSYYEKTSSDESPPASTVKSSTVSSSFKKAKMPRVTLKLRENETIPQMYMKAGIASYKKGNITTSVLAHGLSLEGLIFKTPEGTIKPWSEKWPFSERSSYVQWKRHNHHIVSEQILTAVITVMALLIVVLGVLLILMFKASRKRCNVGQPPLKGRDDEEREDRSKLLGGEDKEDDKE